MRTKKKKVKNKFYKQINEHDLETALPNGMELTSCNSEMELILGPIMGMVTFFF